MSCLYPVRGAYPIFEDRAIAFNIQRFAQRQRLRVKYIFQNTKRNYLSYKNHDRTIYLQHNRYQRTKRYNR